MHAVRPGPANAGRRRPIVPGRAAAGVPGRPRAPRAERTAIPIGPAEALLALAIVAFASAVQASIGFGAGLIAAPILALIHPAFVPAPIIASNLLLTLLVTHRERAAVDLPGLRFLVTGRLVGTVPAALLLAAIAGPAFDLAIALLVLAAVGASLVRGSVAPSPWRLIAAGVASGLMGTLSSIGGPPVALVYQGARPDVFRATLGANLIVGAVLSLAAARLAGRLGGVELQLGGLLLPAALLGFWLSRFALLRVDRRGVRIAVLLLSGGAALALLGRALVAMTA